MFELIAQTFNASVIAVTQLFLSTVITTNPWFENLDIRFQSAQQEIICTTNLAESFTETLDNVLLSGKNITLHFKFELFVSGENVSIQRKEIVNGFRFDAETESYYLINSDTKKLERFFTIEEAKANYVAVRNLTVASTKSLSTNTDYFLKVTAYLDPIKMEDMTESVNLMLRWASVKPTIVSEKFKIAVRAT